MGRKSKSVEKRQEILDAFERVILREGFANASQRKIAEEAGMNQPMIHHYFSGGSQMLEALLNRIIQRYREALSAFIITDKSPSLESILSFLVSAEFHQVSIQNQVMFRLIGQSKDNDMTNQKLSMVYHELLRDLKSYLEQTSVTNIDQVAYTLMCIIIGHDWAKSLGFGENRNQMMVETLTSIVRSNLKRPG